MTNHERDLHQKFNIDFPEEYKILRASIDLLNYHIEEVRIKLLEDTYEQCQQEKAKQCLLRGSI